MSLKPASIAIMAAVLALAGGAVYGLTAAGSPDPPAPAQSEKAAQPALPAPGTPYAEARRALIAQGLTPDTARTEAPHPDYPELDCPPEGSGGCRGLFLRREADGWRRYFVVLTAGAPPVVQEARSPYTAEGLLSIPPPLAPDIPKLPQDYFAARRQLLQLGFKPTRAATPPLSVCARALESGQSIDCAPDLPLPEVMSCSGTGAGVCEAYWLAPDHRVLRILTIGEPSPGDLHHLEWASAEQIAHLPKGWEPQSTPAQP